MLDWWAALLLFARMLCSLGSLAWQAGLRAGCSPGWLAHSLEEPAAGQAVGAAGPADLPAETEPAEPQSSPADCTPARQRPHSQQQAAAPVPAPGRSRSAGCPVGMQPVRLARTPGAAARRAAGTAAAGDTVAEQAQAMSTRPAARRLHKGAFRAAPCERNSSFHSSMRA